MVSSKLTSRRYNPGTPRVTRASTRHRCPPPDHSLECDITPQADPVQTGEAVFVDFWNDDTGLPDGDPLDQVIITAAAGTWDPQPPVPFFNRQIQSIKWTAPDQPGDYLLTATYWWSDTHSCHSQYEIHVDPS